MEVVGKHVVYRLVLSYSLGVRGAGRNKAAVLLANRWRLWGSFMHLQQNFKGGGAFITGRATAGCAMCRLVLAG
jgi:hypothetical protein